MIVSGWYDIIIQWLLLSSRNDYNAQIRSMKLYPLTFCTMNNQTTIFPTSFGHNGFVLNDIIMLDFYVANKWLFLCLLQQTVSKYPCSIILMTYPPQSKLFIFRETYPSVSTRFFFIQHMHSLNFIWFLPKKLTKKSLQTISYIRKFCVKITKRIFIFLQSKKS